MYSLDTIPTGAVVHSLMVQVPNDLTQPKLWTCPALLTATIRKKTDGNNLEILSKQGALSKSTQHSLLITQGFIGILLVQVPDSGKSPQRIPAASLEGQVRSGMQTQKEVEGIPCQGCSHPGQAGRRGVLVQRMGGVTMGGVDWAQAEARAVRKKSSRRLRGGG